MIEPGDERLAGAEGLGARAILDGRYMPADMERDAQAMLDELMPRRDAETNKRKRKALSQQIKIARSMRDWARTRAGYAKGCGPLPNE